MNKFSVLISVLATIVACNGNLTKDVHDLQSSQEAQDARLSVLDRQVNDLYAAIANCASNDLVKLLQDHVDAALVQIATLQGYKNIVSIIDPCGDAVNVHDEVLLKLSDGKILASFSDTTAGKNTRFSVLTQGSYVTTDGSNCSFSVDASGNVH